MALQNRFVVVVASLSVQLATILIFDFMVFRLLKQRRQGLDMYMKTMVVLLSISVFMSQGNNIWVLVNNSPVPIILDGLLTGYPSYTVEMAAILSDIARLWSLVIGISRIQNLTKQVWKYRVDLTISIVVAVMVLATLTMAGLDIAYIGEECPSKITCLLNKWPTKRTMALVFVITSHIFIIVNYIVIFCLLASLYARLKRDYREIMTASEKSTMNKDLASLALLFLSICQLYAVRIFQQVVIYFKLDEYYKTIDTPPDYCKALMIIGICVSVYGRIYIATDRPSYKEQLKNRNSILEDAFSSLSSEARPINLTTK